MSSGDHESGGISAQRFVRVDRPASYRCRKQPTKQPTHLLQRGIRLLVQTGGDGAPGGIDAFRHIDAVGFAFGQVDTKGREDRQQIGVNGVELRVFKINANRVQRNSPADGFEIVEWDAFGGDRLAQQPIQFRIRRARPQSLNRFRVNIGKRAACHLQGNRERVGLVVNVGVVEVCPERIEGGDR